LSAWPRLPEASGETQISPCRSVLHPDRDRDLGGGDQTVAEYGNSLQHDAQVGVVFMMSNMSAMARFCSNRRL